MTEDEIALADFIDARIDSMLRRPSMWGTPESVEAQVLLLVELRRVARKEPVPPGQPTHLRSVVNALVAFIREALPDATAETLAAQLERKGRTEEFPALMTTFIERERSRAPAVAARTNAGEIAPDPEGAARERVDRREQRPRLAKGYVNLEPR